MAIFTTAIWPHAGVTASLWFLPQQGFWQAMFGRVGRHQSIQPSGIEQLVSTPIQRFVVCRINANLVDELNQLTHQNADGVYL
jgi:hypothetical protein